VTDLRENLYSTLFQEGRKEGYKEALNDIQLVIDAGEETSVAYDETKYTYKEKFNEDYE
jgi:hypothetical protein